MKIAFDTLTDPEFDGLGDAEFDPMPDNLFILFECAAVQLFEPGAAAIEVVQLPINNTMFQLFIMHADNGISQFCKYHIGINGIAGHMHTCRSHTNLRRCCWHLSSARRHGISACTDGRLHLDIYRSRFDHRFGVGRHGHKWITDQHDHLFSDDHRGCEW